MSLSYLKLAIAALLPVAAAAMLYLLDKRTSFGSRSFVQKQIVIGLIFGAIAIVGNEWGIVINGATVNCRDAAPLTAGLLFGGPAGIIAGLIGGIERWICVAWGGGMFTRLACSVSTVLAGIYAALLRKYMFDDKKPSWALACTSGIVMEVFHLIMVFITNADEADRAIQVVVMCSGPMITAVGASVLLSSVAVTFLARESVAIKVRDRNITREIQRWLLVSVLIAFALSTSLMYVLQTNLAKNDAQRLMTQSIDDMRGEIEQAADDDLLKICRSVKRAVESEGTADLSAMASAYGITDICVVDKKGIITASANSKFVGFDMDSEGQSKEFMCLLDGTEEYVQKYGPVSYDASIFRKYAGVATDYGFLQVGYSTEELQSNITSQITRMAANRHIGQDGVLLVIDRDMKVIGGKSEYVGIEVRNTKYLEKLASNTTGVLRKLDTNQGTVYSIFEDVEGYKVVALMPQYEVFKNRDAVKYVNAFLEVMIFAILFGLIYLLIKKIVINNLKEINRSLGEITGGNLDVVVNVKSVEEFASLSDDINDTVSTLKHYIDEAKARIDKELEFAREIQHSAIPSMFPAFPGRNDIDIYASMDTAKEVGGDFYDFYFSNENLLNILVADVSGKGIPAALFMMRSKVQLKSLTDTSMSIEDVFTESNNSLCEGNDAGMFVTAWQGQVDLEAGGIEFANAGHNPPLIRRKDGCFEYLRSRPGLVLAGMEGVSYRKQRTEFNPGDTIFLYTDGVTEATNSANELYGEERLEKLLNSREWSSMEEMCKAVKEDIDLFVGEAPQFDDITMLALKYNGSVLLEIEKEESVIEDIPEITELVEEKLTGLGCPMKSVFQLNIAIDEMYSNIAKYAYPDSKGPSRVTLRELFSPHGVELTFEDRGVPYNPLTKEDPDTTLSVEERSIGGLGIFMVKQSVDDMVYLYKDEKNVLRIVKYF